MLDRFMRRNEIHKASGLKDPQMWREEQKGNFPKRRRLTDRTVGWLESEVKEWIESRPTNSGDFPNLKRRGPESKRKDALEPPDHGELESKPESDIEPPDGGSNA